MKTNLSFFIVIVILLSLGCNKDESNETNLAPIQVSFRLLVNGAPIDTTVQYTNYSGEKFKVSAFKFYVSLVEAENSTTGAKTVEKESYHLVDLADPNSQKFTVNLNYGTYDLFNFIVGVDSTRNVSGAQTGALDPSLGMFWTWNTGYIFAKLEGKSPSSSAPFQAFTYHIGGFRTDENAIRKISLPAPIQVGVTNELEINVNLENWFNSVNDISIASQPSIMSPGGTALLIADNYATMFNVNRVN